MDNKQRKVLENRLRRVAQRAGYYVQKSYAHSSTPDNQQGWRVIDAESNFVVAGERYDLTLEQLEAWLAKKGM